MQPNLQRTVEDAQTVQFVIEQWVIDSADKWAFVLQAAGGSVVSRGRQAGLLQSTVQVTQRVRLHPALTWVPCDKDKTVSNKTGARIPSHHSMPFGEQHQPNVYVM